MLRRSIIPLLVALTSACSVHRIDIQQGNIVDDEQLEALHIGMRQHQVVELLGTPLVQDSFRPDRWDYVYYLKPARKTARQYQLTLFFEGDYLVDFITDIPHRRPPEEEKTPSVEDSGNAPAL